MITRSIIILLSSLSLLSAAERINHEGRLLGTEQSVTSATLLNTNKADQVMSSLQIMPTTNPWNERINMRPVHWNSAAIMNRIESDMPVTTRLWYHRDMSYVLVPNNQPLKNMNIFAYPDESDDIVSGTNHARYPIPSNLPIEGWPSPMGGSLIDMQRDTAGRGGDRHSITLQPSTGYFWETANTKFIDANTPQWEASVCAKFNIASNVLRPDRWTSSDAAGLPLLPAVVRYDEVQRGLIEHALRLIVKKTKKEYIYPATHYASSLTDSNLPPMGLRLRLKGNYNIPNSWSHESKVVAQALKTYGCIVADNGNFFGISISPDDRWAHECFEDLKKLYVSDFEVINSTGPNEGPRAPNAPVANAGIDQTVELGQSATLNGQISTGSGSVKWMLNRFITAPGSATFGNDTNLNTTVSFTNTGTYNIMLRIDDGSHAYGWDHMRINVVPPSGLKRSIALHIETDGSPTSADASLNNSTWTALDGSGDVEFTNVPLSSQIVYLRPPSGVVRKKQIPLHTLSLIQ